MLIRCSILTRVDENSKPALIGCGGRGAAGGGGGGGAPLSFRKLSEYDVVSWTVDFLCPQPWAQVSVNGGEVQHRFENLPGVYHPIAIILLPSSYRHHPITIILSPSSYHHHPITIILSSSIIILSQSYPSPSFHLCYSSARHLHFVCYDTPLDLD